MPAIRRSNLGRRTRNAASQRNTRASQTDEQRETRNEVERNRWNRNQQNRSVAFNPYRAAFNYNKEIDYSTLHIVAIGPMNIVCQYCKAFKFKKEAPGLCCSKGQVKLTPLVPPPEPLHSLVSGNGPDSRHFLTQIQQYNNCFQMTSFGATKVIQENFMPTFKEAATAQCLHPVCGPTTIKQEPVETDLLASPEREIEEGIVTNEPRVATDPLVSPKREMEEGIVKDEPLILYEWDLPGDPDTTRDPLCIENEESSPPEYLVKPSTINIEKTEEEAEDELTAVSVEDEEEFKDEVPPTSIGRGPKSSLADGVVENNSTDDRAYCVEKRGTTQQFDKCAKCKKTFANMEELKGHVYEGSCEFLHYCSVCHKVFRRHEYLKKHHRRHTGERRYSCGVCNKAFTTSCILKVHSLQHTGERPYSCGVCNMAFTHDRYLKRHSQLHTGVRPYSCGVCNKTFRTSSNLKVHSLQHTGERPYSCGVCNKTFKQKSHLVEHLRQHTGERPYVCSVCNKTFKSSSNLKVHSQQHTGERPIVVSL